MARQGALQELEGNAAKDMRAMLKRLRLVPIALLAGLGACSGAAPPSGDVLYRQNCVACHGASGAGDGPLAADLPVPPANLRGLAAANGGVFPAEDVMATIYGYRGKEFEGLMPAFGGILDSPETMWTAPDGREVATPSALVALAEYLETLQDH